MDSTTTTDAQAPGPAPASPVSEPLAPTAVSVVPQQQEEDDDDPAIIFQRAEAEIHALLKQEARTRFWDRVQAVVCATMILGGFLGVLWAAITYPRTTVTLVPMERPASLTAALDVPLRHLPSLTVTRTAAAETTGKGHQVATVASGTVLLYNGTAIPQFIPSGTVFLGRDEVRIATDAAVTIPPGNPPSYGQASVHAHALAPGSAGNIAAGDVNVTIFIAVFVRNQAFAGGRDSRTFQAVAQQDLSRLIATLRTTLGQAMPQAFSLGPGESVIPTQCVFTAAPDHHVGDEAHMVSVRARERCAAVTYNQGKLQQQATEVFAAQTAPGKQYELVGSVHATVLSVAPFSVRLQGSWVYVFSHAQEQDFAEQIAGDTPTQAKAALLKTGVIAQATIPQTLPQASYIRFVVLIENMTRGQERTDF